MIIRHSLDRIPSGFPALLGAMTLALISPALADFPSETKVQGIFTSSSSKVRSEQSKLPDGGDRELPFACEAAFGDFTFHDPLGVMSFPDSSGRMIVVERRGTVQMVFYGTQEKSNLTFLDIRSRVYPTTSQHAEEGLLSVAFHPEYANSKSPHRGELFVYYTAWTPGGKTHRLARFHSMKERIDGIQNDSETVLIDQPVRRPFLHGGSLLFGPEGFLYLSRGDESRRFPSPHAQTITNDMFSGVLRLDVDCQGGSVSHPAPRQPTTGVTGGYFIPHNNPFVGNPNALEEYYAIGLRNPWRMSCDRETGKLYVTDSGIENRDEINLLQSGSNFEWNHKEGNLSGEKFHPKAPARPEPYLGVETPPIFECPRNDAQSRIIGGYVYRGKELPELFGKYIYANQNGRIYALELVEDGTRAEDSKLIAVLSHSGVGISSLGEDSDGELYFCAIGELGTQTGKVYRLRRTQQ